MCTFNWEKYKNNIFQSSKNYIGTKTYKFRYLILNKVQYLREKKMYILITQILKLKKFLKCVLYDFLLGLGRKVTCKNLMKNSLQLEPNLIYLIFFPFITLKKLINC